LKKLAALVILIATLLCGSAVATAYYVDASTTEGNVVGDGSSGNPWQTITHALTQVSTGATIHVATGEYSSSMTGSSESFPISIGANIALSGAGSALTTIEGGDTDNDKITLATNVTFEGFAIKGISSSDSYYGVKINGSGGGINNCVLDGEGSGRNGIYFNGVTGGNTAGGSITTCEVKELVNGIILDGGNSTPVTIQYCTIETIDYYGIEVGSSWDTTVNIKNNNIIYAGWSSGSSYSSGIYAHGASSTVTIDQNTIVRCPKRGICMRFGTVTLKNNIISDAPYPNAGPTANGYGIYQTGGSLTTNDYNNVWNNCYDYGGSSGPSAGGNSKNVCPEFYDPWNDNYDLYVNSPCMLSGEGGVNMGAYQGSGVANNPYLATSYVNVGTGTDDLAVGRGSSEANPWKTITHANKYTNYKMNVAAGTYNSGAGESFDIESAIGRWFSGEASASTIVDGDDSDNVFKLFKNITVEGFTIKGMANNQFRAGIMVEGSGVDIRDNLISGEGSGRNGIYFNGDPYGNTAGGRVTSCEVLDFSYYGIILFDNNNTSVTLEGNTIYSCDEYGIRLYYWDAYAEIKKNEIRNSGTAGVYISFSSPTVLIDRNTIVKSGNYGVYRHAGSVTVKNSIIASEIGGFTGNTTGLWGTMTSTYNDVYACDTLYDTGVSPGTGDISMDAQFVDPSALGNDYHLKYNSPCIDAGDPATEVDPDGSRADIGCYPFDLTVPGTVAVYVKSPNGNESWTGYSIEAITWYATEEIGHLIDHVEIAYSTDEGATYTIIETNEANDGSYDWTVANKPTTEALVRIGAFGSAATDESDSKFTILNGDMTPPSLEVISPNGAEIWAGGSQHNITFTVTDAHPLKPNSVDLYYTSGEGWVTIDTGQPTDSAYAWTLPLITTTEAKVKVTVEDATSNLGSDESNAFFTIDSTSPDATSIVLSDQVSGNTLESNSITVSLEALGVSADPYLMRLAENSGFTTNATGWISYTNPTTFTFTWGNGTREVYYQLRDEASNESPVLNDSIVVDVGLYYVDAQSGSDSNTGSSEGDAWKTITYALGTTETSDIILCKAGTYDASNGETFPFTIDDSKIVSGESAAVCFIIGSAPSLVEISGGATLKNFTIINTSTSTNGSIVKALGSATIMSNKMSWQGTAPEDSKAMYFANGSSGTLRQNTIYNVDDAVYSSTANSVLIDRNTIANYSDNGILQQSGTLTVTNNIISSTPLLNNIAAEGTVGMNRIDGSLTGDYNNIWGNDENYNNISAGTNDITQFSRFVDATNNDYNLFAATAYATQPNEDAGEGSVNIGADQRDTLSAGSIYRDTAYVSPSGTDDPNLGYDASNPFRTLTYALTRAAGTLNLDSGTYDTSDQISRLAEGVTIQGASRAAVSIIGSGDSVIDAGNDSKIERVSVTNDSDTTARVVVTVYGDDVVVDDIRVYWTYAGDDPPTDSTLVDVKASARNLQVADSELRDADTAVDAQSAVSIERVTIANFSDNGVINDNTGTSTISDSTISQAPKTTATPDANAVGVEATRGEVEISRIDFYKTDKESQGTVTEKDTIYRLNPKFTDADANDYSLKSDSPLIGLGDDGATIGAWQPDYSGDFIACHITTPDGGETLGIGNQYAITWYASKGAIPIDKIDLYYSTDSGATFAQTIASNLTNTGGTNSAQTGIYAWTAPDVPTSSARVRVIATVGSGSAQDDSDSDFTISHTGENIPPNINVRVGGYTIIDDDYIDRDTTFDVYLTDNLSLDATSLSILLDGASVSYTTVYNLGASMHVQHRAASLAEGTHDIHVEVSDLSGNVATQSVTGLQVEYGAANVIGPVLVQPTPFAPKSGGTAKLVYHLNKDAATTIYVYSPSRLEWTRKYAAGINGGKAGYNEVSFSGVSEIGQAYFGNGIYVFKIVADGKAIGKGHIVIYD